MRIKVTISGVLIVLMAVWGCKKTSPDAPDNKSLMHECVYNSHPSTVEVTANDTIPSGDYIFYCSININTGGKLVIMPGTTIRFNFGKGITLADSASLLVRGTDLSPVILTSVDEVREGWSGILSYRANIDMTNCTISYGKCYENAMLYMDGGTASFQKCKFYDAETAVFLRENYYEPVNLTGISDCIFEKNDWPLKICQPNVNAMKGGNSFINNTNQYIYVHGACSNTEGDVHFYKNEVPFLLSSPSQCPDVTHLYFDGNVMVDPGGRIIMNSGIFMNISGGHSMICNGTPSEHITISGKENIKGYWGSLVLDCDSTDVHSFEYTDFSDGGRLVETGSLTEFLMGKNFGIFYIDRWSRGSYQINIKHCSISNAMNYGAHIRIGNNSIINGAVGEAAVYDALTGAVGFNTFTNCPSGAVLMDTLYYE